MQPVRGSAHGSPIQMPFQYIAIEGPIGVGKTSLAERLAARLDATAVLEDTDNPFLPTSTAAGPARRCRRSSSICSTATASSSTLQQADLFAQATVCDYLFDKDKIFAYLNLDDNELFIYQRLYDLLAKDIPAPDLVIYLQAPTDVLRRRLRDRRAATRATTVPSRAPNTSASSTRPTSTSSSTTPPRRSWWSRRHRSICTAATTALDDLIRQIRTMNKGTRYYVPRQ